MPLVAILPPSERIAFDAPPILTGMDRKRHFRFPTGIIDIAKTLQTSTTQVCFLVLFGYFKATSKFFNHGFDADDVTFVAKQIGVSPAQVDTTAYSRQRFAVHKAMILQYVGWYPFTEESKDMLRREVRILVRSQTRPKTVLKHVVELLKSRRIEIPSYHLLATTIREELQTHQRELGSAIKQGLTRETKQLLDVLVRKDKEQGKRYRLTLLKRFSQSTQPRKIKENIEDLATVRELFVAIEPTLKTLSLTRDGIRYYAYCVLKFDMPQVMRRKEAERYLYLIAFIAHQYYTLQDYLVDILVSATQSATNVARKHQLNSYEALKPEKINAATEIASVIEEREDRWQALKRIVLSEHLTNEQKLEKLISLIRQDDEFSSGRVRTTIAALKQETQRMKTEADYYHMWEAQSVWLQNRATEILKHLTFNRDTSQKGMLQGIDHFLSKNGKLTASAPLAFLPEKERMVVVDSQKRLRVSLYKALLFKHAAAAIKAGRLNLTYSYRYRSIEDILLSAARWKEQKESILEQTDLLPFATYDLVRKKLETELNAQYERTNRHMLDGSNPYINLHKDGSFRVFTPRREDGDRENVLDLFPKPRSIPLLEVLATVSHATGFLQSLSHWQITRTRDKPKDNIFFAGIIGLGCNIGIQQIARISKDISVRELEHTVNLILTRFSG